MATVDASPESAGTAGAGAGPLVLASAAAVRAAMLRAAGLSFTVRPARVDEGAVKAAMRAGDPEGRETARALAALKARRVSAEAPGAFVVGRRPAPRLRHGVVRQAGRHRRRAGAAAPAQGPPPHPGHGGVRGPRRDRAVGRPGLPRARDAALHGRLPGALSGARGRRNPRLRRRLRGGGAGRPASCGDRRRLVRRAGPAAVAASRLPARARARRDMILTGAARLAGVMGWPVAHSRSPRIHGYWLEEKGIDGAYLPLAVPPERLAAALAALPALGFSGCNLTAPHKEAALPRMATLSETARRIGAVNTVTVGVDGALHGDNTDGYGFIGHLRQEAPCWEPAAPVAVLGAGGAARAVVDALAGAGAPDIRLVNRSPARAAALAEAAGAPVRAHPWSARAALLANCGLLVNTTTLGQVGGPALDLDLGRLPAAAVVYGPGLRAARDRPAEGGPGARAQGGGRARHVDPSGAARLRRLVRCRGGGDGGAPLLRGARALRGGGHGRSRPHGLDRHGQDHGGGRAQGLRRRGLRRRRGGPPAARARRGRGGAGARALSRCGRRRHRRPGAGGRPGGARCARLRRPGGAGAPGGDPAPPRPRRRTALPRRRPAAGLPPRGARCAAALRDRGRGALRRDAGGVGAGLRAAGRGCWGGRG